MFSEHELLLDVRGVGLDGDLEGEVGAEGRVVHQGAQAVPTCGHHERLAYDPGRPDGLTCVEVHGSGWVTRACASRFLLRTLLGAMTSTRHDVAPGSVGAWAGPRGGAPRRTLTSMSTRASGMRDK